MEVFLREFFLLTAGKDVCEGKEESGGGGGDGRTKAAAPLRVVRATRSGKERRKEGRKAEGTADAER